MKDRTVMWVGIILGGGLLIAVVIGLVRWLA
jgi:hypothetical protein